MQNQLTEAARDGTLELGPASQAAPDCQQLPRDLPATTATARRAAGIWYHRFALRAATCPHLCPQGSGDSPTPPVPVFRFSQPGPNCTHAHTLTAGTKTTHYQ